MNEHVLNDVVKGYFEYLHNSCCACNDSCVACKRCEALVDQGEETWDCYQLIKEEILGK